MFFFFSSRRRHTRCSRDWSSDVCSSDLDNALVALGAAVVDPAPTGPREASAKGAQYESTPEGLVWLKETRARVVPPQLTNFTARIVEAVTEDAGVETRTRFALEVGLTGRT